MITYENLKRKAPVFQSFTGLTLPAFQHLLPAFAQAYAADLDQRDQHRPSARQRQRRAGRHSPTAEGTKHDKQLADEQDSGFPEDSTLSKGNGFQGYQPPHGYLLQPKKKPKGGR